MTHNLDYIKSYNVLYVEDDKEVRKNIANILEKFFGNVIIGNDGLDGYNKYCDFTQENQEIHLIIADINMPNKNGLEMLADIKKLNRNIQSILITAHNEPEYLIEAIKLGVARYISKPLKVDELMEHIHDICEAKYNKENVEQLVITKNELKQYLDIVNRVAIISKTDSKGHITYVNDIFCEISGYTKEELIGKPHNIIRHPEIPKDLFQNLWETISKGETWKGKLKNLSKNGEAYYVDANVFPIYYDDDRSIKGYMSVRFLITDAELEKRTFKQQVIKNIIQYKNTISHQDNIIEDLNHRIKYLENDSLKKLKLIDELHDKLYTSKSKNKQLLSNIENLENNVKALQEKLNLGSFERLTELKFINKHKDEIIQQLNKRLEDYNNKLLTLQETVTKQESTILELNKKIRIYNNNLKDI